MDEIGARPIKFAGREVCEACHSDQAEVKAKGKHVGLGCEACHGPLARHAEGPDIDSSETSRHRGFVRTLSRGQ